MSSCTLAADFTVSKIVEAMLPRGGSLPKGVAHQVKGQPTRALYIRLRIDGHQHIPDDEMDEETRWVHLIFERPSTYTKVFSFVSERHVSSPELRPEDFDMQSDHDSCWRSDGLRVIDKTWFAIRDILDGRNGRPGPDNRQSWFNIIDAIEWLAIVVERVPDQDCRKRLTSIERERAEP